MQAAYVKGLNIAGARVVPLFFNHSLEESKAKIDKCNGLFYAGGDAGQDYTDWGHELFNYVLELNDQGIYYPIWGTCLGFENLAQFTSSDPDNVLSLIESHYENPLLKFIKDPKDTEMFSPLREQAMNFEKYNMTLNSHSWGLSPNTFKQDEGLANFFIPTSVSYNDSGIPFVASMEARKYPVFGT